MRAANVAEPKKAYRVRENRLVDNFALLVFAFMAVPLFVAPMPRARKTLPMRLPLAKTRFPAFDDIIIANSADNTLEGGIGDDVLNGGAGDDMLMGGEGDDLLLELDDGDDIFGFMFP